MREVSLQVFRELRRRFVASIWDRIESLENDAVEITFQASRSREGRSGLFSNDTGARFWWRAVAFGFRVLIGKSPRKYFVEDNTEAVNIASGINATGAGELLRAHVGWSSDQAIQLRLDRNVRKIVRADSFGDAEVAHLYLLVVLATGACWIAEQSG